MPRQYIVNSWVGAAAYDEGDTYSGEQIGNRNQKSIEVPIRRSGDQWKSDIPTFVNGRPNISAFSEPKPVAKQKVKPKSLMYRILPQQSTIDRLEAMREELENEFDNGIRSLEEYQLLSVALDKKLDRAFKALERATSHSKGITMPCGENAYNSGKSLLKQGITIDYSIIPRNSVFSHLSDGNIFKIFAVNVLTAKRSVAKMYTVVKQIVEEGLL